MPQSMLAFLAMAIVVQFALTQHRSDIHAFEAMIDDEIEIMANAVALEQLEIIFATTEWESLDIWSDSVTTRKFTLGGFEETFELGIQVQYVTSAGKLAYAPTTMREVTIDAMNKRFKLPLVSHARLISK